MSQIDIETRLANVEKTNAAMLSLLRKIMDPTGKITANMTIEELIVNVTGKTNATFEISTANVEGKILLSALKDFDRTVFAPSAMCKKLDDRGWHTPDGTVAPTLSVMVKKGLLVKEDGGYRLPSKVTYTGEALSEA